jgi:hypothetical protein
MARPGSLTRALVVTREELVEGLLPRGRMQGCARRKDPVEIEQARPHSRPEAEKSTARTRPVQVAMEVSARRPREVFEIELGHASLPVEPFHPLAQLG